MNPWCRPVAQEKQERPTLVLLLDREEAFALAVGAGCEEEGIPLVWERAEGGADELARKAAGRSRLEVGIGLDREVGAVTFAKYPSSEAYLRVEAEDMKTARWLGQAAARFVKSKPLPGRETDTEETPAAEIVSRPEARPVIGEAAPSSVPVKDELSEAVVDRITQAVLEALRRQR